MCIWKTFTSTYFTPRQSRWLYKYKSQKSTNFIKFILKSRAPLSLSLSLSFSLGLCRNYSYPFLLWIIYDEWNIRKLPCPLQQCLNTPNTLNISSDLETLRLSVSETDCLPAFYIHDLTKKRISVCEELTCQWIRQS